MNKKIIIGLILLIIAVLFVILNRGERPTQEEPTSAAKNSEEITNPKDEERVEEKKRKRAEQRKRDIRLGIQQANVPINFWGKVIDQNGEALEGVKITYRIQQPRAMWDSNSVVKNALTDSKGNFSITGDKGSSFGIKSFEKEGYEKAKGQRVSFTYSDNADRYVPDRSNPKTYTLIKRDELPGLVPADGRTSLAWDGKPIRYNLRTGKFGDFGEIQITASRGEIESDNKYSWTCKIEVVGGGVYESSIENMYLAPEEGYKSFVEYGYVSSVKPWGASTGDKYLFVFLPEKKYGRIQIRLDSGVDLKTGCFINSYLNPTGGRLLEYDAQRRVK